MASRFSPGAIAYARDGRSYTVEAVDGGTVYCTSANGAETEFPESILLSESEWAGQADGRRDVSYSRLKQAPAYSAAAAAKIDGPAAEQLLAKVERISPSLLDFAAFTVARRILVDNKDGDLISGLSIVKSRRIFDEAKPEIRARLLGELLGVPADRLLSAVKLGDNLMRAMVDQGMAPLTAEFEEFLDRPRR